MTTIPGPLNVNSTAPKASFEVPIRPQGAKSIPSIGQRNPRLAPVTAAIGNNDIRVPGTRGSFSRFGAAKATSSGPIRMQRRRR